jgi:hypothetical protein
MPQKLSTTFSGGPLSNEVNTKSVPDGKEENKPILQFGVTCRDIGALQTLPSIDALTLGQLQEKENLKTDEFSVPSRVIAPFHSAGLSPVDALSQTGAALQTRQLWQGTVTCVTNGNFVATLKDLTTPENPDEEATFEVSEVDESDRGLVQEGASFYWIVGKVRSKFGTQSNTSFLRFTRVPVWTPRSLKAATSQAKKLADELRER